MANLCKFNMCDSILIDENPQIGAKDYDLEYYPQAIEMQWFSESIPDGSQYVGCPKCCTDGYLSDNIE